MAERVEDVLRPCLLDRLIGEETGRSRGEYDYVGVRELRDAVARDLVWLLNSKQWVPYDLDGFEEARESVLTYGVPDFSSFSWRSSSDSMQISQVIEEAIRRFEPRLVPSTVKVEPVPGGGVDDFQLHFRIEAVLQVDPITEPVSFDTSIDFDSTNVEVTGTS